jgi:hypothetical protein
MPSSKLSPADYAAQQFDRLIAERKLATWDSADLTEADTRSKLIDPLFKWVLGWGEIDIRREEPVADGFVDYLIGAEYPHLHVEAKRLQPRFRLSAPSRSRILQLSGPHLLGERTTRPVLEQAARYAFELGTDFALVTNGDQFIIFKTKLPGRKWREGFALVWHDYQDVKQDFAAFFALLSRDSVRAGSLFESFEKAEGVTTELYSPLEFVHNPDAELVRNRFWDNISRIVGPLLTDQPDDTAIQDEIIQHCYVRTPLSDEADRSLDALLEDKPPAFLSSTHPIDLRHKNNAFDRAIELDVKASFHGTYILTGGVGSGKTTFLRRFAKVVQPALVKRYCVWVHVDYLSIGSVEDPAIESELPRYTFRRIRDLLTSEYTEFCPSTGAELRQLFSDRIDAAKLTLLHGLIPDSPQWNDKVNQLVHNAFSSDEDYVLAVFRQARARGMRIVLVLDNTDQLGENFQAAVFLLSQRLARDCGALAIVSLREEKFFAAYRRGIFDAYGDRRFHIGSPNLEHVIRRRLEYAIRRYKSQAGSGLAQITPEDQKDVERILRVFINSTTGGNRNIVRLLACVSNGDMRYALSMFKQFVSSGNTNVNKILRVGGGYIVPFHEFAKSAVLGSRRFYRSSLSHIVNLFIRSSVRNASHLTACRLLARLSAAEGAASPHGEGFVETTQLLAEYRQSFGHADDLIQRGEELLRRGLLESEPPRVGTFDATDAIRISASGAYYWRYLVRSFAYLDLILVDTPVTDRATAEALADMSRFVDLTVRFERVRRFLQYLAAEEAGELSTSRQHGGPYTDTLIAGISVQVEREIDWIKQKTGAEDVGEAGTLS